MDLDEDQADMIRAAACLLAAAAIKKSKARKRRMRRRKSVCFSLSTVIFFFFVPTVSETVEASELSSSEAAGAWTDSVGWGSGVAATLPLPLPFFCFAGMVKLSM